MNAFADDHPEEVAVINFHPWWTSITDPFYQHNPSDNTGRVYFYIIPGVPFLLADGVLEPGFLYDYSTIETAFQERLAMEALLEITLSGSFDPGAGQVDLLVGLTPLESLPPADYRLQVVLTESDIYFPADNGIEWHHHTMRRMIPDFEGTPVDPAGALELSFDFILDTIYVPDNCRIVCFVQDTGGKEILQTAFLDLAEMDGPGAAASLSWSAVKKAY